jgi:hypothetical protein
MKHPSILTLLVIFSLAMSCNYSGENKTADKKSENKVIPVTDLLSAPARYENQEISVSGLCTHTCRRSGKRLFLEGKNHETTFLVTASNAISKFDNTLEGQEIIVRGQLIRQKTESHNHNHEEGESCDNESRAAHFKLIASQVKPVN